MSGADGLARLNRLAPDAALERFLACCGSRAWARAMAERRPYDDPESLMRAANEVWWGLAPGDWLEAFAAHPRIGGKRDPVEDGRGEAPESRDARERAAPDGAAREAAAREGVATRSARWSEGEQAGARSAADGTLRALEEGNRRYEERFGHVFLIRAAGRSAGDMLSALTERMSNEPEAELRVAAAQQAEITGRRLARLIAEERERDA